MSDEQREADLEAFDAWWAKNDGTYSTVWLAALAYDRAQQPGWVACSERLPQVDVGRPWMVFNGHVHFAAYQNVRQRQGWTDWSDCSEVRDVTYWAELPAPPQETPR